MLVNTSYNGLKLLLARGYKSLYQFDFSWSAFGIFKLIKDKMKRLMLLLVNNTKEARI